MTEARLKSFVTAAVADIDDSITRNAYASVSNKSVTHKNKKPTTGDNQGSQQKASSSDAAIHI